MRKREDIERIANSKGWILNPDVNIVQSILKRQNMRYEKEGDYYCPCKPPALPENICRPCENSLNEIKKDGHCHCNLFYDQNWQEKTFNTKLK